MTSKLPIYEWLIIVLLLLILFVLIMIAYVRQEKALPPTATPYELVKSQFEVTIQGAVSKPGTYLIKKGSLLEEAIELARPLPEADLRSFRRYSKVRDGQKINVPTKQMITVTLEGAIENPGPIQVPKGSRLEELIPYLQFTPEADVKKIQRKRRLKDQEVIHVPQKTKSKK